MQTNTFMKILYKLGSNFSTSIFIDCLDRLGKERFSYECEWTRTLICEWLLIVAPNLRHELWLDLRYLKTFLDVYSLPRTSSDVAPSRLIWRG